MGFKFPEGAFKVQEGSLVAEHGQGMYSAWVGLAYQEPPDNFFGRLLWTAGVLGQLIVSTLTFPAAIGSFLMEESVQSYGMGAYMLASSGYYDLLDIYLSEYATFIGTINTAVKSLATVNPIAGGAVIIYIEAAKQSYNAFRDIADRKLIEQAEKDEKLRLKMLQEATKGTIHVSSSPTNAEIWLDGVNTEQLTPETLKLIDDGVHTFELRKFNTKLDAWDIFVFDVKVTAGYKSEILARIPPGITSPEEDEPDPDFAQIRLSSTPSNAEIYINGEDTGLLTPETFKAVDPGTHTLKLRIYSRRREEWDEMEFNLTVEENKKYEYKVNIPAQTHTEEPPSGGTEEDETPQLPDFMKATVTGDYAIDGDTFVTDTGERIRILGIDAPEMGQPYSQESKEMMHDMISGKKVYLKIQVNVPLDIYGRTLAICTTSRGTLAYLLLIEGLARVLIFDDAEFDPTYYNTAETLAKERKVGIWSELP